MVDESGKLILDSMRGEELPSAQLENPENAYRRTEGSIRLFKDESGQNWFYQIRKLNEPYFIISAIPRPPIQVGALFQDELLRPLFRVGVFALLLSFFVSWFIASWITRPLERISTSAKQLASGDFPAIPLKGPTEVQELADVINRMDQKVRNSIQSQKEFVANVSHEFKTPLTSIQGFAQAILDDALDSKEKQKLAAEVILDETERLNYLVNDLLMLAKLDAGTMALNKSRLELKALLENILSRFTFRFEEEDLKIETSFQEEVFVRADGERLVQVFNNLIDNAIKFTLPGGKIRVELTKEGNEALISVIDSGIGIPEDDLEKIFDRFYQVEKSRLSKSIKSVGLGLSIAREIIEAHTGKIVLESELGKGSCFMVKLPLADEK